MLTGSMVMLQNHCVLVLCLVSDCCLVVGRGYGGSVFVAPVVLGVYGFAFYILFILVFQFFFVGALPRLFECSCCASVVTLLLCGIMEEALPFFILFCRLVGKRGRFQPGGEV